MRIAIDGRELIGRPTGVGRYLRELLTAWGDLPDAADHEFVLCSPDSVDPSPYNRLRLSSVTAPGSGTLWEQRVLPKLVASAQADVLFSPAYTCPLWCPVPIVLVIHDVSFAAHPEWFPWREGLRRRTLTRLGARRAARVITDADFSKDEITRLLGVPSQRIDVIYLGASALHEAEPGEHSRAPLVLYVGSLFNRRHVPELIEGFQQLATRKPEARLEIVGDNRTYPHEDLSGIAAMAGIASSVSIRSYVSDDELAELYGRARVFALLSEYEGFGHPPLEALGSGVPSLLLDTEVAREVCGNAARYVAKGDIAGTTAALNSLMFDDDARRRVLGSAPAVLARYSWTRAATETLAALEGAA